MFHMGCKPLTNSDAHEVEGSMAQWIDGGGDGRRMVLEDRLKIHQSVVILGMWIPGIVWGFFRNSGQKSGQRSRWDRTSG